MKKIIFLLGMLILLTSSIVIALQGGSANSYSTDASKYLFYTTFNGTDSTTIPNAESGHTISESTGTSWQIRENKLYTISSGSTDRVGILVKPITNFTLMIYYNYSVLIDNSITFAGYGTNNCQNNGTPGGNEAYSLAYLEATSNTLIQTDGNVTDTSTGITTVPGQNLSLWLSFRVIGTTWNYNVTVYNVTNSSGTLNHNEVGSVGFHSFGFAGGTIVDELGTICFVSSNGANSHEVSVDEVTSCNYTSTTSSNCRPTASSSPDTTPPNITFYNMTSEGGEGCIIWNTNKATPCPTSDTTPTVNFTTNEPASCAIGTQDINFSSYNNQGVNRNCTIGQGTLSHTCSLILMDELVYDASYIYISCEDANKNQNRNSTSGSLALSITGLETLGRDSMATGIQNALLSGYTNYTDLQIYARNLSSQVKGTFDRVVKKGNKIWAFNRIGVSDSHVNMFNLTPVLYTLEFANKTSEYITNQTERLINATK